MTNYEKIEKAIEYLTQNFKRQPDLEEVARQVFLSPFHDLFISIEGMSPGVYKNGGHELEIHYRFAETIFGDVIIANTEIGICYLSFTSDKQKEITNLFRQFPKATLIQKTNGIQQNALQFFSGDWSDLKRVKLHLKATPFQLKVWQSLLKIPFGSLSTYSSVAQNIDNLKAVQAVGTAIGSNPVAFLIPCHRVIKSSGLIGEYHWGPVRKNAILGWEASKLSGGD